MLKTVLEAVASALINLLTGWLARRRVDKAEAARTANQAAATRDAIAMRDANDRALENSHAATDADRAAVRADGGVPDGLREQSSDVQRAIDRANGAMQ